MQDLAHVLLFEPDGEASLSSGHRELIASYVSSRNPCYLCETSHGAAPASHIGGSAELVTAVCADPQSAEISNKLKAFLVIAAHVQSDANTVTPAPIEGAREQGATNLEIHDAVLIAAAFCVHNCYANGLATWQPRNEEMGRRLADYGYTQTPVLASAE